MEEKQDIITSVSEMTAGEMLKNARTTGRRKREIATIAKLLCIREEFLAALEEGNYRFIPEDVYILGFARSYAVELGLDPDEVINKLKRELGIASEKKEDKKDEKKEEKKEERKDEKKEEPEVKKELKIKKPKRLIKLNRDILVNGAKSATKYVKKHWIWFSVGVVVIIALATTYVFLIGKQQPVVETVAQPEVIVEEPVVETKNEPDFRYPVREKFNEKSSKESRVVLQAEKESWVKIEDARGNTVFSRVLVPGDVYYMPLNDKLKGTFGNAGAIDVWVDAQLVNKVGPANTRKSGISMAPDALKAVGLAE